MRLRVIMSPGMGQSNCFDVSAAAFSPICDFHLIRSPKLRLSRLWNTELCGLRQNRIAVFRKAIGEPPRRWARLGGGH
jgi:hypothetical protein